MKIGTRVRIVGRADWSSWNRPMIGAVGTIKRPPGAKKLPGYLWFETDKPIDRRSHRTEGMYVRPAEVERVP